MNEEGNVAIKVPTKKTEIPEKICMTESTTIEDDDVLYIKMIPGISSAVPKIVVKPEPGTSKGEEEAEEAETETEDEEEIDVDKEEEQELPINKQKIQDALKSLSECTKMRSKAFEKLTQAVPLMTDAELKKIPQQIPAEITNKFDSCVYEFLEDK